MNLEIYTNGAFVLIDGKIRREDQAMFVCYKSNDNTIVLSDLHNATVLKHNDYTFHIINNVIEIYADGISRVKLNNKMLSENGAAMLKETQEKLFKITNIPEYIFDNKPIEKITLTGNGKISVQDSSAFAENIVLKTFDKSSLIFNGGVHENINMLDIYAANCSYICVTQISSNSINIKASNDSTIDFEYSTTATICLKAYDNGKIQAETSYTSIVEKECYQNGYISDICIK